MRDRQMAFEVTRSLFETARQYVESFNVYGDKMSFEWTQVEDEQPVTQRVTIPDYARLLPEPRVYDAEHAHLSFTQGGGHGGSNSAELVGQDGILRPIGNRPLAMECNLRRPISNRPQDSILPYTPAHTVSTTIRKCPVTSGGLRLD
jgi:hypothetical protein